MQLLYVKSEQHPTRTRIETEAQEIYGQQMLAQGNTSTRTRIETREKAYAYAFASGAPGQYFHQNKD